MVLTGEYVPSTQQWVRDQVEEYEASGGTRANTLGDSGYPIMLTTSVGAKSGKLRKVPLMRVERDGKYLAVASKGGAPEDPEWANNYRTNPRVDVQDGPEPKEYVARELEGEEYADWWRHAVDTWPTYGEYEVKAAAHDRVIPIFLLEPVED